MVFHPNQVNILNSVHNLYMRWYGHVLRRDDGHVLRNVLEFEVPPLFTGINLDQNWIDDDDDDDITLKTVCVVLESLIHITAC